MPRTIQPVELFKEVPREELSSWPTLMGKSYSKLNTWPVNVGILFYKETVSNCILNSNYINVFGIDPDEQNRG